MLEEHRRDDRVQGRTRRRMPDGARVVVVVTAAHLAVDALTGTFAAVLPALGDRFTLRSTHLAALVALMAASALLSQPFMGRVADRFGPRAVTGSATIAASVLLALVPVAGSLVVLIALVVAGGLASAAFHPAAAAMARGALPARPELGVSSFAAGGTAGMALGPLAHAALAGAAGLHATPLLMGPGVVLGAVLVHVLPAVPRRARPAPTRVAVPYRAIAGVAAAGLLAALASTTFTNGVPLLLSDAGAPAATIAAALAAFSLAAAAGGIAAGAAVRVVSPRRLVVGTFAAAVVPLAAALLVPAGSMAFLSAAAAAGALTGGAFPILVVAAQDLAPGAHAAASGVLMGLTHGVAGLAFVGVGVVVDVAGPRVGLLAGFGAIVPAALVAAQVVPRVARAGRAPAGHTSEQSIAAIACRCLGLPSGATRAAT